MLGKYSLKDDPGSIPHSQALSTALSGTLGLGNIAGVAIAISVGGPGSIFWMWVTAIVGVSTKFYTASLSVMYRHQDLNGQIYGGPMYVIMNGMGKKSGTHWRHCFAGACMIGALPVFQANQFVQLLRDVVAQPLNLASQENHFLFDLFVSFAIALLVFIIIRGKIYSIGSFAVKVVPLMVIVYLFMTFIVVGTHFDKVLSVFRLIITDAFSGSAVAGGSLATVIMIGVRRGAFSNEAGIGTESMAHGTAKTREPIREGLVAMLGPVIDTLIMCTCTAFIILLTGVWQTTEDSYGVTLTMLALQSIFFYFWTIFFIIYGWFIKFEHNGYHVVLWYPICRFLIWRARRINLYTHLPGPSCSWLSCFFGFGEWSHLSNIRYDSYTNYDFCNIFVT